MKVDTWSISREAPSGGQCDAGSTDWRTRPTKEAVRSWLQHVIAARKPPPSISEIHRELWHSERDRDGGTP